MRVCLKHRAKATETLVSRKTGCEYDLCPICEIELSEILYEKPEEKVDGRKNRKNKN